MRTSFLASCTFLLMIIFVSCKTVAPLPPPPEDESSSKVLRFEGEFRSTKGVQSRLGCYCYNTGVLKQADESVMDLCFDENVEITCSTIRVTGRFVMESIQVDENNPCASGSMKLFRVISYTCL